MSSEIKVLFIHGLESSPQGNKARLFSKAFRSLTPAMNTQDFESCITVQKAAVRDFAPDIVVGSSFGGAVALALLQQGFWNGKTLLLAQAGLRYGLPATLPSRVPIWIVHGRSDDVIDCDDSRRLAAAGEADFVKLIEVDDDHPLSDSVENGALLNWVRALAAP